MHITLPSIQLAPGPHPEPSQNVGRPSHFPLAFGAQSGYIAHTRTRRELVKIDLELPTIPLHSRTPSRVMCSVHSPTALTDPDSLQDVALLQF